MNELPKAIKARIQKESARIFSENAGNIDPNPNRAFIGGCIIGSESEALRYIPLLRFAGCPDILIENPNLIIGKTPTDEDMEWVREAVVKHEQQQEGKVKILTDALKKISAVMEKPTIYDPGQEIYQMCEMAADALAKYKSAGR